MQPDIRTIERVESVLRTLENRHAWDNDTLFAHYAESNEAERDRAGEKLCEWLRLMSSMARAYLHRRMSSEQWRRIAALLDDRRDEVHRAQTLGLPVPSALLEAVDARS